MPVELDLTVTLTGPLFDGRASRTMQAFRDEAVTEVAQAGVDMVHAHLDQVLQNPTGYYESQIQTERVQRDVAVTDGGVVYGPWLEGIGSRNRTTRFKGYSTFRRVHQIIEGQAGAIAQDLFERSYQRRLS